MGNVFKFKQFQVEQEGCAMRINTDGVLLAAVTAHPSPGRILDIGTGTGVLALMLAQRFPEAEIDAVEIDGQASSRASENFRESPYADRLSVIHTDIAEYLSGHSYDLIISNPPFFVNDLKSTESRKRLARHADEHFFISLLRKSDELLDDGGFLWLILPVKQADFVIAKAAEYHLALRQEISVCSDSTKPVIRKIICLGRQSTEVSRSVFYIYESQAVYTEAYRELIKDFFLAF